MDTLFRLVSLQASSEQQHPHPQQQSPSYNSRSTTSSGSRSSSHQTNASYNYYYHSTTSSGGGGGGQYSYYGQQHPYYLEPYQEECHHLYMDEDFSSSSSSRHQHHLHGGSVHQPPTSSSAATPTAPTPPLSTTSSTAAPGHHALFEPADLSYPPDLNLDFSSPAPSSSGGGGGGASSAAVGGGGGGRWGSQLLLECARAVAARDSQRVQQLMWMLNELASPYGDLEQKLASYFLQGLFARLTSSGPRTLRTLAAASDRNTSFDSTRRTALRFQELSPWSSFGHVAANGAILESFLEAAAASSASSSDQAPKLHILDLSNTFCTQWPTLLEALATRSADDTPHLSITTVVQQHHQASSQQQQRVMREIGQRMERFARLMGVPFAFHTVHHAGDLADLDLDALNLRAGDGSATALAVNCVNALRGVNARRRDAFMTSLRRLDPRVVTVVEEEADLVAASEPEDDADAFLKVFGEGLRFFSAYMDSLEESFPKTSNERLALERAAGRAIVDLVSCPAAESVERRETAAAWERRMRAAGFAPVAFSEDVADDVRSLLRRYREGWSMRDAGGVDDSSSAGVFLAWKEQPLVWASAWKP